MIVLDATIVNVALPSIRADWASPRLARLGRERLPADLRRLPAARRAARRPARPPAALPARHRALHRRLAGLRPRDLAGVPDRGPRGAGARRGGRLRRRPLADHALFTEPADRAKAMGVFGFVAAGGGSVGVLLGGVLTDTLSWHWIFLVNIPIGDRRPVLSLRLLRPTAAARRDGRLDVAGAVTVTASLMLAVYAIVNGNEAGWTSAQTLGLLGRGGVLIGVFLVIESRVEAPLVPLRLFKLRNIRSRTSSASSGRRRCSPGSSSRRSTCGSCSATARCGRARLPARQHDHGRLLARPLGQDRDALRHPRAARRSAWLGRARAPAIRARAGRRGLRGRRAAEHDLWASAPAWRSTRCCSRR